MKYTLPRNIKSAKEDVTIPDTYAVNAPAVVDGSNDNHLSVSLPIPRTKFREDFINQAKKLKELVGIAETPERVEKPTHNLEVSKDGTLKGEVDTQTQGDEIEKVDLVKKAETVYEGVKRPKFKKTAVASKECSGAPAIEGAKRPNFKKIVKEEPSQPLKDEAESSDKQPKEAVACESRWGKLNKREARWIQDGDVDSIKKLSNSENRKDYLLKKLASESVAEESVAVEAEDESGVDYYVYKFYEDGSLINTAYTELYQASADYSKTDIPCAFVAKTPDAGFIILESKDLDDSQEASVREAVAVLNEDGNELVPDVAEEEIFTEVKAELGTPLLKEDAKEDLSRYKLSPENLAKVTKGIKKRGYVLEMTADESIYKSPIFRSNNIAEKFAQEELGLLPEDYQIVEYKPVKEELSSKTWYALVASESQKTKIDKIKVTSSEESTESEVKDYLASQYGGDSVYTVSNESINF